MTPSEIRIVRASEISDFEWLFRIYRDGGRFRAFLVDETGADARPIEDWQPDLDGEDAYFFYCATYLDGLLGDDPDTAYALAHERLRAEELLEDEGDA